MIFLTMILIAYFFFFAFKIVCRFSTFHPHFGQRFDSTLQPSPLFDLQ